MDFRKLTKYSLVVEITKSTSKLRKMIESNDSNEFFIQQADLLYIQFK